MILSFFNRKGSPNYYVQCVDPEDGKRRCLVTPVQRNEADAKLKLAKIRNKLEKKILEGTELRLTETDLGWAWVSRWIELRYANKSASLTKHRNQWNFLSAFLREQKVFAPSGLTRDHALKYIQWRCSLPKEKSKRTVGRNTALADLQWAGTMLREAMERQAINRNPWEKLGFERDDAKEKPELLDEHIAIIRANLLGKPERMRRSFEIALHTGLRFSETRIALRNIDELLTH